MTLNQVSTREAGVTPLSPESGASAPEDGDLLALARFCLEDMKAEELVEIDLAGKTSIADAMIVASGRSERHVGAIADRLLQVLKEKGFGNARVEGLPACDWVLIDAGDVIVHIFRPEVRGFYNLEKMWGADRPAELAAR
jgi:ribosome-associated protein